MVIEFAKASISRFRYSTFASLDKPCPKLCSTVSLSIFKSGWDAKVITQDKGNISVILGSRLQSVGAVFSKSQ